MTGGCDRRGIGTRRTIAILAGAVAIGGAQAAPAAPAAERICGWLLNPTPGNWDLADRRDTWELGVQGGYQAPGLDGLPDLTVKDWVVTNAGSYGYGCGCARVVLDRPHRRVARLIGFTQRPLAACRADRRLPAP